MNLKPLALALATVSLVPIGASATDLHSVLVDCTLTSWNQKDGLPTSTVWALAQDHEGYLWLGTDVGPIRFDGARFVPWETIGATALPKAPVRALLAARDGSIWFGFGARGGVSRLRSGELHHWSVEDGIGGGLVTALLEDRDGSVWLGTSVGLFHYVDGRWKPSGDGLPQGQIYAARIDKSGRLLVGTASGLFAREA